MAGDIELLKIGGLITSNSDVQVGDEIAGALDLVVKSIESRIKSGKRIVLVPSAHKFPNGYGVTDYLEDPINVMNYLRSIDESEFSQLSLASPELEKLKRTNVVESGELVSRHVGLDRYVRLIYQWHLSKAREWGIFDDADHRVINDVCNTIIRKRANYLYKLQDQIDKLAGIGTEINLLPLVEERLEDWRASKNFKVLPDIPYIQEIAQGVIDGMTDTIAKITLRNVAESEYKRTLDKIITMGEPLSTLLISRFLRDNGIQNRTIDRAENLGIVTNRRYSGADVLIEPTKIILNMDLKLILEEDCQVVLLPGFCGATFRNIERFLDRGNTKVLPGAVDDLVTAYEEQKAHGHLSTTSLGRGGSDSTAAIVAGCLGIKESYWVKAKVGGVLTAKPDDITSDPIKIARMDFMTAVETGAIQQRAVELARDFGLEVFVTDLPDYLTMAREGGEFKGTRITSDRSISGPKLESGKNTYFIAESSGKYLSVPDIRNVSGELSRILAIPGRYGANLAETMHHLSTSGFIFNNNADVLLQAAEDIKRKLGYESQLYDCAYFRLVGADMNLEVKQKFENVVKDAVGIPKGKFPYFGPSSADTNAVTSAVSPDDFKAVKLALYRTFIEEGQ